MASMQQETNLSATASIFGWISLGSAIAGLVLPLLLAGISFVFIENARRLDEALVLCNVLCLVLQGLAFTCGIVGRKTVAGKIGIVIPCLIFTLVILAGVVWFVAGK